MRGMLKRGLWWVVEGGEEGVVGGGGGGEWEGKLCGRPAVLWSLCL